ncbi:MAG TPA: anaerobic ribonucleoside triphosphate reductase, partial [Ruminococcaceae bacterium]|nr:anaerobic ribonucleoside triphosphate reductase [Oscillospiraceae bacterium]
IYRQLTFRDAKDVDLKRENANIDADTAMGTMLKYGSEGSKYFVNNYILPKDIAAAHVGGDIHIHDEDFYMLTETCCQIDLLKLFRGGFCTGHGTLREPQDISSYAALACIAIQANQNEMHGGQSIPNFDYSMAPGVAKTFR